MIKVLLFAQLAEDAGKDSLLLEYETDLTPRQMLDTLETRLPPEVIASLRHDAVMLSVNQVFAAWDDPLNDGDEVAFLPPFSGG